MKWSYTLFTLSITKLTKSFSAVFAIFTFWSFCTTITKYLCPLWFLLQILFYYKYTGHNFCLKISIISTGLLMKILKNPNNFYHKYWFSKKLRLWNTIRPGIIIEIKEHLVIQLKKAISSCHVKWSYICRSSSTKASKGEYCKKDVLKKNFKINSANIFL